MKLSAQMFPAAETAIAATRAVKRLGVVRDLHMILHERNYGAAVLLKIQQELLSLLAFPNT